MISQLCYLRAGTVVFVTLSSRRRVQLVHTVLGSSCEVIYAGIFEGKDVELGVTDSHRP